MFLRNKKESGEAFSYDMKKRVFLSRDINPCRGILSSGTKPARLTYLVVISVTVAGIVLAVILAAVLAVVLIAVLTSLCVFHVIIVISRHIHYLLDVKVCFLLQG